MQIKTPNNQHVTPHPNPSSKKGGKSLSKKSSMGRELQAALQEWAGSHSSMEADETFHRTLHDQVEGKTFDLCSLSEKLAEIVSDASNRPYF